MSKEKLLINDSKSNNGEVMRNKQIEEIIKVLNSPSIRWGHGDTTDNDIAEELYNAGYRKQSEGEWISVDERFPEENTRVLVYLDETLYDYTHIDTDRIKCGNWIRWGRAVTHWMPLPEAPKKGGAE